MRKVDEKKDTLLGKAVKAINFDKIVLHKLENMKRQDGVSVSKRVNLLVRRALATDATWYTFMAAEHAKELAKYEYLAKVAKEEPVSIEFRD